MVRHFHNARGGSPRRQAPKQRPTDVVVETESPKQSDVIEMEGRVMDILGFGNYSVKLDDVEMTVIAYSSGKMNKNNISIIIGDKVKVELNPLDPTKGRIVYRQK